MAVLAWIGALAVVIFLVYSLPSPVRYSTFALALGLLVGWILLPVIYRVIRLTVNPIGKSIAIAIETYGSAGKPIAMAIILSLIVHFIQAGCHVILGWSLDFQIPWSYSFILYPLVGIFMAIPVSFNGIGLCEGVGLLWFVIVVLDGMIGGVVFILRKSQGAFSITPGMGRSG